MSENENRDFFNPGETRGSTEEHLKRLETELRLQRSANQHLRVEIDRLNSRLQTNREELFRLVQGYNAILTRVAETEMLSRSIVASRIWRTLVAIGGWLLALSGRRARIPLPAGNPTGQIPLPLQLLNSPAPPKEVRDWIIELRTALSLLAPIEESSREPLFSIITPTWNTRPAWFAQAALSVLNQTTTDWEWCIVDDASTRTEFHELLDEFKETDRVRVRRRIQHGGISAASNEGLQMARGKWVCFLDHDDELSLDALARLREAVQDGCDAVYSDSDKIDEADRFLESFYKPDWSPEYFRAVMYVGHLLCVRRSLAMEIGGFDSEFDGVQDYEFFLRYSEHTQRIGHIPRVLYHWRAAPGSMAASTDAKPGIWPLQKSAVQSHLNRTALNATAEFGSFPDRIRILPIKRQNSPAVSVVIPTRDAPDMIRRCLDTLFAVTTYSNFEVICVDNDTVDPKALKILARAPVRKIVLPGKFNFSVANNLGARQANGSYLVFMNNDIETIKATWIEEMLFFAEQEDIGAVGAQLLYPNRTVQHAGIVLGCRGTADHAQRGVPATNDGYAGALSCAHEVSAATAACLMIKKDLFEQLGGFNEHFHTAYQDVDLCLRIRQTGRRIIYTPHATFVHHESYSRGNFYDHVDRNLLLDLWEETIENGDPYYNPHFDKERLDYTSGPQTSQFTLTARVAGPLQGLCLQALKLPAPNSATGAWCTKPESP